MHFVKPKKYNEDDTLEFEIDISYYDLKNLIKIADSLRSIESYADIAINFGGICVGKTPFDSCPKCATMDSQLTVPIHLVTTLGHKLLTIGCHGTKCLNGKCNVSYMTPSQMIDAVNKILYILKK